MSAAHPDLVRPVPTDLQGYVRLLCVLLLEPWRLQYGAPFRILSGYRPLSLNSKVDGSKTSQHTLAQAVDITCSDTMKAYQMLLARAHSGGCNGIGQAIFYPAQNFIHVALASERYPSFSSFVSSTRKQYVAHEPTEAALEAAISFH